MVVVVRAVGSARGIKRGGTRETFLFGRRRRAKMRWTHTPLCKHTQNAWARRVCCIIHQSWPHRLALLAFLFDEPAHTPHLYSRAQSFATRRDQLASCFLLTFLCVLHNMTYNVNSDLLTLLFAEIISFITKGMLLFMKFSKLMLNWKVAAESYSTACFSSKNLLWTFQSFFSSSVLNFKWISDQII